MPGPCLITGRQLRRSPQNSREGRPRIPVEAFPVEGRETTRLKHFSYRTEPTYLAVLERYFAFHRYQ